MYSQTALSSMKGNTDLLPRDIIDFWFAEGMERLWFNSTTELDRQIAERFQQTWEQAHQGKLRDWASTAEGCLALIIILDQFPLNMFRGKPESFATEAQAVALAKHAIEQNFDQALAKDQLAFLYMPLMHSEDLDDQNLSVNCFEAAGLEENARFARHHREIIKRFGRFPHRNAILDRESTMDELTYLNSPGAFKG